MRDGEPVWDRKEMIATADMSEPTGISLLKRRVLKLLMSRGK
jgi:hypothetical protein